MFLAIFYFTLSLVDVLLSAEVSGLPGGDRLDCVKASDQCLKEQSCSTKFRTLRQCVAGKESNFSRATGLEAKDECRSAMEALKQKSLYNCRCKRGMKKEKNCLRIYWSMYQSLQGNDLLEDSPYEPVNSRLSDIFRLAPIVSGRCCAEVNSNFLVKPKKSTSETFQVLTEAYGEEIPKIELVFKGTHFLLIEHVKAKPMEMLNSLSENDLWNCFECWHRRMQLCVNSEGNCFEVEPVLSKGNNCLDAAKACNLNDTCKRFRSAYITPCTSSTSNEICNKRKCHKALRLFFDKVPPKHSYGMLFCSCRDVACTERRRQTIVPVCSYEDREKPNCLNLQESCKKNYICRSRLADFFTNCQPESRSVSSCLKENYADCLLAYSGLIGTVMTPNYIDSNSLSVAPWCDCSNSGNDIEECRKFLNFFQDNTCLKNAIQAFGNGTDVNVWQPILPVQTTTATTTTAPRLKNTGSETTNNEIPTHNDSPACANLQAQKKRKSNESVDTELCLNENTIGKDNTAGVSTSHISAENSLALPTSFNLSTLLTLMTFALSLSLFLSSSVIL